jgi:hypothetical protein
MEPDAPTEMTTGKGLRAPVFSWLPSPAALLQSAPALKVTSLKVTFHPLDIFLPRSKLRSTVTSGMAGLF